MLVRGRRLDPRRILRYLFQELLAPWIQLKRFWLRIVWFFTTPIYIGPMWTTSVVAGLMGVMLTVLLFRPPGRLEASTKPVAVTPPPPVATFLAQPAPPEPTPTIPWEVDFVAGFHRTLLSDYWNQSQQGSLVSTSTGLIQNSIVQPIQDSWAAARYRITETLPAIYRRTAPLWNQFAAVSPLQPADQPASYGAAGESHPGLIVTRDLPDEVPPSAPVTYSLVVKNIGAEILEQILVAEELANLDRVESTLPSAEVSATALHWRIDSLLPGQERRFAIRLQPGTDLEIRALADVRTSVSVSSSTRVAAAAPLTIKETPPLLMETPRLAPVEPASREVIPKAPKLSVIAEIPTTLKTDDELSTVFVVTNSGNGDADGVVLTVAIPPGLEHRDGKLVEHYYAHIPAGTTKRAVFKALARTPSTVRIDAELAMAGQRVADWTTQILITAKPTPAPAVTRPPIAAPDRIGPVPEDGPRQSLPSAGPQPPVETPLTAPIDSSIPRIRRPQAPELPAGTTSPSLNHSGGTAPSSIPKNPAAAPAPAANQATDDSSFANVPRRQGAGGVSGWKRVMHR